MPRSRPDARTVGRRVRARARALDELDEAKLAMAFWLAAKRLHAERTASDRKAADEQESA